MNKTTKTKARHTAPPRAVHAGSVGPLTARALALAMRADELQIDAARLLDDAGDALDRVSVRDALTTGQDLALCLWGFAASLSYNEAGRQKGGPGHAE